MCIVNKFNKVATYLERLLPIKLHDLLIKWCCEVTLQMKPITSPLQQRPWPPNFAR